MAVRTFRRTTGGERRFLLAALAALVALAWLALWLWGRSPYGRYLDHEQLEDVLINPNGLALILVFVAGWTVMVIAMMLPTVIPLIRMFHTVARRRADRLRLLALLIAGYLTVWVAFGVAVHAADRGLHVAVEQSPWLDSHEWAIGAATLLLVGLYQFSSLKYRCLSKCRTPFSFISGHWHGGSNAGWQAFRLGADHGVFCLGCCWALMLLMFALAVGSLGWMLALAVVMAIEKNVVWGRRLTAPVGVALIGWSLAIFLTPGSGAAL